MTTRPAARHASARDHVLLLVLSAMWGGSFPLIKLAVAGLPPLWVAGGRITLGALTLLTLIRLRGMHLPRGWRVWARLGFIGFFGNVTPFGLISWGETQVPSGVAAILMALVPLIVVVVAHFTLPDEPLSWGKSIGVALGIAGVVVLIGPTALSGVGGHLAGELAILLATLCYSAAAPAARGLPALAPEEAGAAILLTASPTALVFACIVTPPGSLTPTASAIIAVALLGVFCTGLAYIMFLGLIARAGAGFASMNNFLVPPFSVVYGRLGLGERLPVSAFAALALILAGVAAQRLRRKR